MNENQNNSQPPFETPAPDPVAPPVAPSPAPMPGGVMPENASDEFQASFQVTEDDFREMGEGFYPAKLIKVESQTSKSGNPMYKWSYVITDGEWQGEELFNYTALTPAAMWKLKETLVAMNIQPVNGVFNFQPVPYTENPNGVINKQVTLDVELQEYEGQNRPSISRVLAFGSTK